MRQDFDQSQERVKNSPLGSLEIPKRSFPPLSSFTGPLRPLSACSYLELKTGIINLVGDVLRREEADISIICSVLEGELSTIRALGPTFVLNQGEDSGCP